MDAGLISEVIEQIVPGQVGRRPALPRQAPAVTFSVTDAWLKANHRWSRPEVEEVADERGLSPRLSQKGKIVFQMRYRYPKKKGSGRRLDLGTYPKMSLKEARDENDRLRKKLDEGHSWTCDFRILSTRVRLMPVHSQIVLVRTFALET